MLKSLLAKQCICVLQRGFAPPRVLEIVGKESCHLRVSDGFVESMQQRLLLHGQVEYSCVEGVVLHLESGFRYLQLFNKICVKLHAYYLCEVVRALELPFPCRHATSCYF